MKEKTVRPIQVVFAVLLVAGAVFGTIRWLTITDAKNFQTEFGVQPPQSDAEWHALRPRVVAKLTELSNTHGQAWKEYNKLKDEGQVLEGETTPQAVMTQGDLRRELVLAERAEYAARMRLRDACTRAFDYYREEVRVLRCPGNFD